MANPRRQVGISVPFWICHPDCKAAHYTNQIRDRSGSMRKSVRDLGDFDRPWIGVEETAGEEPFETISGQ